jgi:hypothetical protein
MRTLAVVLFALLLSAMVLRGVPHSEANAGAWLSTYLLSGNPASGSPALVVKITKKKNKGNKCAHKHSCPAGYVVLDKPNQYGACCELKEGLPKPAPAEPEKCKFGMIGTPPNDCHCPFGTEFAGYKGCIKSSKCVTLPGNINPVEATNTKASQMLGGCTTFCEFSGGQAECCCN